MNMDRIVSGLAYGAFGVSNLCTDEHVTQCTLLNHTIHAGGIHSYT